MKRQNVLIGLLVAVLAGGGIWWFSSHPLNLGSKQSTTNTANTSVENINVTLPSTVSYQGVDGKNALELLKASHTVTETNGFVEMIDGRANSKTSYWFLYVNGKSSEVGAKDYITKSTDAIEWRFEEYKAQ